MTREETIKECAEICNKLGDEVFSKRFKASGNQGIAVLSQRPYRKCADALLALLKNSPERENNTSEPAQSLKEN